MGRYPGQSRAGSCDGGSIQQSNNSWCLSGECEDHRTVPEGNGGPD